MKNKCSCIEYGHYLQSQAWGSAYLSRGAIPSLFDTFGRKGDHGFHPIEQDANMRAFKYLNKHVNGFYKSPEDQAKYGNTIGWNFDENRLNIYGNGRETYVDFENSSQMSLVNNLKINHSLIDYFSGSNPFYIFGYGFRNHVHYNKHKFRY